MAGFAFIDNTDLIVGNPSNWVSAVVEWMQWSLSFLWYGSLQATGRDIVPKKSFWYLIDYKWLISKCHYQTLADMPGNIYVTDGCGKQRMLTQLELWDAKCMLGIHLALDGNNEAEVQYLWQVVSKWCMKMATAKIPHKAAEFTSNRCCIQSSGVTTFSEVQCKDIMKPVLNWGLPSMEINWHLPQAVAHGPLMYQV